MWPFRTGTRAVAVGSLAAAVGVILWLLGPGLAVRHAATAERPNIILITIDALRADHLGVYGYARPTSPVIDAFAREAVVVSHAIAQAPYTKASIASLLTGLFPSTHKAVTVVTRGRWETGERYFTDVLGPDVPVLPESLKAAGYTTLAFSAHQYLSPELGFGRGFDRFSVAGDDEGGESASVIVPDVLDAIDRAARRPFFVWVHLLEPHNPYTPPEPYRSLFPPDPPRLIPDSTRVAPVFLVGGSRDVSLMVAGYDGEIRAVDAALGTLFGGLRRRGLWEETVIVLTADHGEEFFEHGNVGHGTSLRDEQLRVPLLIKAPSLPPRRIEGQAQLVDLFPTLARLARAPVPARLHGADLMEFLEGRRLADPYAFAEISSPPLRGEAVGYQARRFALRTPQWKYISSLQGGRQLFDLTADPGEQVDLAPARPQDVARFESMLARVVADAIKMGESLPTRPVPVNSAVIERLRALGYVD